MFNTFRANGRAASIWDRLSPAQRAVLHEMILGSSNKEIADKLNLSPLTVKSHVAAILSRLEQPSRCRVIALWLKSPPPWADESALPARLAASS